MKSLYGVDCGIGFLGSSWAWAAHSSLPALSDSSKSSFGSR